MAKKKKLFLRFAREKDENEPVYRVYNREGGFLGDELGQVYYNSKWRKFIFEAGSFTFYDARCLKQLVQFLEACDKRGYKNMWRENND